MKPVISKKQRQRKIEEGYSLCTTSASISTSENTQIIYQKVIKSSETITSACTVRKKVEQKEVKELMPAKASPLSAYSTELKSISDNSSSFYKELAARVTYITNNSLTDNETIQSIIVQP